MFGYLLTVIVIAVLIAGCEKKEARLELVETPSPLGFQPSDQGEVQPTTTTFQSIVEPSAELTVQSTSTPIALGPLFDSSVDIKAGPIGVPLELQIPSLKIRAPVVGVGLTSGNVMDAPKGPIGDPIWHTAFWYRGSGIPGESGTATIAGHVNDPLGRPEIFAHLQDLEPGDLIIIRFTTLNIDISFSVDQVKDYSVQESSDIAVLTQIYGAGPLAGTGPQPAFDGLAHITLITCSGNIVNGQFDHHIVVYATHSK